MDEDARREIVAAILTAGALAGNVLRPGPGAIVGEFILGEYREILTHLANPAAKPERPPEAET